MQICRRLPRLLAEGWTGFYTSVGARSNGFCTQVSGPLPLPTAVPQPPGIPPSSSQYLAWLSNSASGVNKIDRIAVPMTQPLPGLALPVMHAVPLQPPPTEMTILPNGARIVSEASSGPTASLGIYVNSGSIFETNNDSGCSALLECLAFKTTKHRSTVRIMQEIEKVGSSVLANASREQMSYTIDCLKTSVPEGLELLADAVLNPRFTQAEVDEQKSRLAALLANKDVQMTILNELLIRHAYRGALSHPLIPDIDHLQRLSPSVLHEFVARTYTAPHIVLAAAGVDHKELVTLATPMLAHLPGGTASGTTTASPDPVSAYAGAFVHLPGSFPQANLLLAFEYKGGWRDVQGAVAMTVLTYLLGGGNSFSSGGPGKGMHSRLYTRVLNQYAWVHSCSAFNSTFNGTGLVGVQASCEPAYVHDMLNTMCGELEAVSRSISNAELDRAKKAAISIICNALESKATSAEDIGRQYLTYGHRISGRDYVEMIHATTPAQVQGFVAALLKSKPSLAVFGDQTERITYEHVLNRYSQGTPAGPTSRLNFGRLFGATR